MARERRRKTGSGGRLVRRFTALAAAALVGTSFLLPVSPAAAQPQCALRDDIVAGLSQTFAEVPVSRGLASDGKVVEIFSNTSGSSWTIIVSTADGVSCIVADGEAWQRLPIRLAGRVS